MHTKNESSILYRGRENHVFPKPDIKTDIHTYRRMDISVYRVASLKKNTLKVRLAIKIHINLNYDIPRLAISRMIKHKR